MCRILQNENKTLTSEDGLGLEAQLCGTSLEGLLKVCEAWGRGAQALTPK